LKQPFKDDDDKTETGKSESSSEAPVCRICLEPEEEDPIKLELNPLITPCKCSGTMRHIHIDCIKSW
jgi:E3 ubiquitin-protein ligase DOA10